MKFQLLHRAIKGTPVVSLNTVMCSVHIRLLARHIHNTRILPTATATRPTRLLLTVNSYIKFRLRLASGQVSRRSQGTPLPSSGEPKVSNPWKKCVMQKLI
jgi:hypothetical protein